MRVKVQAVLLAIVIAIANAQCVASCVDNPSEGQVQKAEKTEGTLPPCHLHYQQTEDAPRHSDQVPAQETPAEPCGHTTFVADVAGSQNGTTLLLAVDVLALPVLTAEPVLVAPSSVAVLYDEIVPSPPLQLRLSTVLRT